MFMYMFMFVFLAAAWLLPGGSWRLLAAPGGAPSKSRFVKMLLKPTVLATFWRALSEKGPERLNRKK